jgi:hypothetical protein
MVAGVFFCRHYAQVFWGIVQAQSVNVVNYFSGPQRPAYLLLSNFPMLKYITVLSRPRGVWGTNIPIPSSRQDYAPFPCGVFCSV